MDITDFLEARKDFFSPEVEAEIRSRLVLRALKKQEPGFVLTGRRLMGKPVYVVMFDDGPELWIQVQETLDDALDFCEKYNLRISMIDGRKMH